MKINVNFDKKIYKMIEDVNVGQCFIMLGKEDLFIMGNNDTFTSIKTGETIYTDDYFGYPVEIKENLVICEQPTF